MRRSLKFGAALGATLLLTAGAARADDVKIGIYSEPSAMDPHYHNLGPNNSFSSNIYDALIIQDENQNLTPGLAVSWEPVSDLVWEFKLRKGVKFHDGSDFNADDVMFTSERAPNVPNSPSSFGTYLKGKTFSKVDDLTIRVTTERPYPLMPVDLSTVSIISSDIGANVKTADFNAGPAMIGTGPYKFVEWLPSDRIVLVKNENYWGEKAAFDKVTMKPIKSNPTRVAALLSGDVDMIDSVPTADIETLKKTDGVTLASGISNRVIYLHMDRFRDNSPFITGTDGKNPLKDLRVRQAISMAINRDAIVSRVMEGIAIPAGQLLPPGFFGTSDKLKPQAYNPKRAKELLAEAGYQNGFGLTIHGPNDRYINDAKIAQAIGQMLTRVGIKTQIETMPKSVYFRSASRGGPNGEPKYSFILVGWGSGTGEASSPLKSLVHTHDKSKGFGASNRGRYSNPKTDKLIEDALATVDDTRRAALLAEATEIAISDLAVIPLHYQVNTWATTKGLKYLPRTDERTSLRSLTKQ